MQTKIYPTSGFTLIEIILAVVLVGILVAVAIPNFCGSHRSIQNACINNLRRIDGAKDQWAFENGKKPMDPINKSEVDKYIRPPAPSCPGKGIYTYGVVGTNPTCTLRSLKVKMHALQ